MGIKELCTGKQDDRPVVFVLVHWQQCDIDLQEAEQTVKSHKAMS